MIINTYTPEINLNTNDVYYIVGSLLVLSCQLILLSGNIDTNTVAILHVLFTKHCVVAFISANNNNNNNNNIEKNHYNILHECMHVYQLFIIHNCILSHVYPSYYH